MTGRDSPWQGHLASASEALDGEREIWSAPHCAPFLLSPEEQYNVSRKPSVWAGAAVIAGSAIPVFMIEDLYKEEQRLEDVLEVYPWLSRSEVLQALAYADAHAALVVEDRARHEQAFRNALGN